MKVLSLMFLLFGATLFAQGEDRFELNTVWKFQLLYPVAFGDNALAKSYDNNFGLGIELGLFKYNNFRLGGGYNIVQYTVTDPQMIGNIKNANYDSMYGYLSYDFQVADKIAMIPDVGYGGAGFSQRNSSRSFGSQNGNEYRAGLTGNYNFTEYSSVFVGLHFIHTSLDINTSPEFEKFFGKMNQIQFAVGVQFD